MAVAVLDGLATQGVVGRDLVADAIKRFGVDADRQDPRDQSAARRSAAHLAKYAGRRLVASGLRSDADSLRLHQHSGCGEGFRSEPEVRRDYLRSRRRQLKRDHPGTADVRQSLAVEENGIDAEPGRLCFD